MQLGAIKDVLDWVGLKPVDRQQVEQANNIENLSDEELHAELDKLFGQQFGLTQDKLKKAVKDQQHYEAMYATYSLIVACLSIEKDISNVPSYAIHWVSIVEYSDDYVIVESD